MAMTTKDPARRPILLVGFSIWVALIVLLTTFESLLILATQYCPPPPREHSATTKNKNETPPQPDAIGNLLPCDPISVIQSITDPDRITAFGTIVVAVFTIVLGIGTWYLVTDGRENARRQLRAYIAVQE